MDFIVKVADKKDAEYATEICREIEASAASRGTGIAKRTVEYIESKILAGRAVIALSESLEFAGFCYIESWGHDLFVANSGLIVAPNFRKQGLASRIKKEAFELSRKSFPNAKIFGLTTSLAVMNINSEIGYKPVTYSKLTNDQAFWDGCKSCVNYETLQSKSRSNCLCTAMLFEPSPKKKDETNKGENHDA